MAQIYVHNHAEVIFFCHNIVRIVPIKGHEISCPQMQFVMSDTPPDMTLQTIQHLHRVIMPVGLDMTDIQQ
jgi:hypothetical protein